MSTGTVNDIGSPSSSDDMIGMRRQALAAGLDDLVTAIDAALAAGPGSVEWEHAEHEYCVALINGICQRGGHRGI